MHITLLICGSFKFIHTAIRRDNNVSRNDILSSNKINLIQAKRKKKKKEILRRIYFHPSLYFLRLISFFLYSKFFLATCLRNHHVDRRIDTLITLELELECHFNSSFATVSRKPPNDPVTYYQASR